eukprot:14207160-Alexandrium_andersonii.AAC.1
MTSAGFARGVLSTELQGSAQARARTQRAEHACFRARLGAARRAQHATGRPGCFGGPSAFSTL